jgi:carbon monoxide dehydrogenase subunit G
MGLIPGCDHLEQVSSSEYRGQIQLRLPAVAGTFQTYVRLMDYDEPNYCQFAGEVSGAPGSLKGTASFWLEAIGEQTHIRYQGQAVIAGALSHLNERLVEGVAQTLIKQGLHKLNQQAQT